MPSPLLARSDFSPIFCASDWSVCRSNKAWQAQSNAIG